jgi:hypothetical protein
MVMAVNKPGGDNAQGRGREAVALVIILAAISWG